MDPLTIVQNRKGDITTIEKEISADSKRLCKQPFQRIPRFLRRRASSHNSKRLPSRFRAKTTLDEGHRNKPSKPRLKSSSSFYHMPTHKWHSKRCLMTKEDGYVIPLRTNEKLLKSCVKSAVGNSFAYDMSYYKVYLIESTEPHTHTPSVGDNEWKWFYHEDSEVSNFFIICKSQTHYFLLLHPLAGIPGFIQSSPRPDLCAFVTIGPRSKAYFDSINSKSEVFGSRHSGAVVIMDVKDAFKAWVCMIRNGSAYGALRELKKVTLELGLPFYPCDFPSKGTIELVKREALDELSACNSRPKSKCCTVLLSEKIARIDHIQEGFDIKEAVIVSGFVLGKGRVDPFSYIYDCSNFLIGYVSRCDFSELQGRVKVIACVLSRHFSGGQKVRCEKLNGQTISLVLDQIIL